MSNNNAIIQIIKSEKGTAARVEGSNEDIRELWMSFGELKKVFVEAMLMGSSKYRGMVRPEIMNDFKQYNFKKAADEGMVFKLDLVKKEEQFDALVCANMPGLIWMVMYVVSKYPFLVGVFDDIIEHLVDDLHAQYASDLMTAMLLNPQET
ncbi:hypothetical protein EYV94_26095 [Puteibacter caeruleilacunae]|nr:hypothetical protein EYV94_26095 [Puteibacter caeruleilacunae]